MAVVVQCFHCNAILELDDGFRGGVCRCSTCGSLLQVPQGESDGMMPRKRKVRPAKPMPHVPAPAPANAARTGDPGLSSGRLDPRSGRADIGVSSGLSRIHPTRPISQTAPTPRKSSRDKSVPPPPRESRQLRNNRRLFWLAIGMAVVIMVAAAGAGVYYFAM